MPAYFIVGATGHQGMATALQLLAKGHEVRAIVRNATSESSRRLTTKGAKLYQGSYHDKTLLTTALANTVGVFLNPYIDMNDVGAQTTLSRTIIDAACAAGTVKHIVAATAFLTGRYDEFIARDENFPIRWYYDEKVKIESIVKEELYTDHELADVYQPGVRMPYCDEEDVGRFAVAAFEEPARFAGESIELAAENPTIEEVATALNDVSGVHVKTRPRRVEEAEETKEKVAAQEFHDLANWTDISIPTESLAKHGLKLTSLRDYFSREKDKLELAFGIMR